jgi:hypothetical protein
VARFVTVSGRSPARLSVALDAKERRTANDWRWSKHREGGRHAL